MKLVFVAGMEHSGTTLTDYLLSGHPRAAGIGEAASFFSPAHMAAWSREWPDDPHECSCGRTWTDCPFWGPLHSLCGLHSDAPLQHKYARLVEHARRLFGDESVLVDSSKYAPVLRTLLAHQGEIGLAPGDLRVVLTAKDVRSFTKSVASKRDARPGLLAKARTFNWWRGGNTELIELLDAQGLDWRMNLYERLCADPEAFVAGCYRWLGMEAPPANGARAGHTHIAMGNKDFSTNESRRQQVTYDARWLQDDQIKLLYLLHAPARAFNRRLYAIADAQDRRA